MKKIIFFFFGIIFSLNGISQTTFHRAYGDTLEDRGSFVQNTIDGGYILAGFTASGAGGEDVYVIKTDSFGNLLWTKTFGGLDDEIGSCIRQTNDGGYIISGTTASFGAGGADIYLIKTDSSGDTLWVRTYGGSSDDFGSQIQQTYDGGYIIISTTSNISRTLLIKTDVAGNVEWSKTYRKIGTTTKGCTVLQTNDSGFVMTGFHLQDLYLYKLNSSGDTLWTKKYVIQGNAYGSAEIISTTDGGFIIGTTSWLGAGSLDVYLIKVDSSGDTLWTNMWGGIYSDDINSIEQTTDGGYIVAGVTHSFGGGGSSDAYLIKTNSIGDTLWTWRYGSNHLDGEQATARQTFDGGYIIGATNGYVSDYDAYLIKVDSTGNSGCRQYATGFICSKPLISDTTYPITIDTAAVVVVQSTSTLVGGGGTDTIFCSDFTTETSDIELMQSLLSLSPNPATSDIMLKIAAHNNNIEIEIYNFLGEKWRLWSLYPNEEKLHIDVSSLPNGIYFVKIRLEKEVQTFKFIKQ